jgi:mRNA interferase MazF
MMKRGDVVTVADRSGGFTGKPRPSLVAQSDFFADTNTVVICPLTSDSVAAPLIRFQVEPSSILPLNHVSWVEVDMITAVRKRRIGPVIGRISDAEMLRLNSALAVFLGLG